MFTIEFSPKAEKQISKLEQSEKAAIKKYLKENVASARNKKGLYDVGGTELAGNLKDLWRFKDSSFRTYRIIAYLEDERLVVIALAIENKYDPNKNNQ